MDKRLVVYVDGSVKKLAGVKKNAVGWGMLACHNSQMVEKFGGMVLDKDDLLSKHYEQLAFVHGVAYAVAKGYGPQNTTMFCDDELFGYAALYLHEPNFMGARAFQIHRRVENVTARCFDDTIKAHVYDFLLNARVVKLKGHKGEVHQERTDYLAKLGVESATSERKLQPRGFNKWVRGGFYKFVDGPCMVLPPFVEPNRGFTVKPNEATLVNQMHNEGRDA